MIEQANLIPPVRQTARRRRSRVRFWISACTVYALVLVAAGGALQSVLGSTDSVLESEVSALSTEISGTKREVAQVQPKLVEAKLTLAASQAVGSQPNWSVLLTLLADALRDPSSADGESDLVLSACELERVSELPSGVPLAIAGGGAASAGGEAAKSMTGKRRFSLRVAGVGKTQAVISQYVLRLEQTGLFERVTLLETKRTPFVNGEAVAFRLDCLLGN